MIAFVGKFHSQLDFVDQNAIGKLLQVIEIIESSDSNFFSSYFLSLKRFVVARNMEKKTINGIEHSNSYPKRAHSVSIYIYVLSNNHNLWIFIHSILAGYSFHACDYSIALLKIK